MIGNPSGIVARPRRGRRRRARTRHPARRRQHAGHALPVPAHRARRRHRGALGDQVHRGPRHRASAGSSSSRVASRGTTASSRCMTEPVASYDDAALLGELRRVRLPACACASSSCATSAPACPRSTRSSSCSGSRRWRCGWSATSRTPPAVAKFLAERPQRRMGRVRRACRRRPWHQRAKRYLPKGPGAVFAFGVKGGRAAGQALHRGGRDVQPPGQRRRRRAHSSSIPASTTHQQLDDEAERSRWASAPT